MLHNKNVLGFTLGAKFYVYLIYIYIYIPPNATTCPCGLRGPPSWAWQECNRLLRVLHPWAQLRCPDDVSGDIRGCSARRALKPKFYQPTQIMVTAGILPFREILHGRAGNRTRDLIISSQRPWPLDHMAGHINVILQTVIKALSLKSVRKVISIAIFGRYEAMGCV